MHKNTVLPPQSGKRGDGLMEFLKNKYPAVSQGARPFGKRSILTRM
jgi:hypothetical protein